MKKRSIITIAILIGVTLPGGMLFAQSDAIKIAREAVIQDFDAIRLFEADTTLSPEKRLEKELMLKRRAFNSILTLTTLETTELKEKLTALPSSGTEYETMTAMLAERLESYLTYASAMQKILADAADLPAVQELISQFNARREASYAHDVKTAVDLLLAIQVKTIIAVADERLGKTATEVTRAHLTGERATTASALLAEASESLTTAHVLYGEIARALIARYTPEEVNPTLTEEDALAREDAETELGPGEPTTAEGNAEKAGVEPGGETASQEAATEEPTPSTETFPAPEIPVRELVQSAILEIKNAYRNFLEIADTLQKKATLFN